MLAKILTNGLQETRPLLQVHCAQVRPRKVAKKISLRIHNSHCADFRIFHGFQHLEYSVSLLTVELTRRGMCSKPLSRKQPFLGRGQAAQWLALPFASKTPCGTFRSSFAQCETVIQCPKLSYRRCTQQLDPISTHKLDQTQQAHQQGSHGNKRMQARTSVYALRKKVY